MFLTSIRDELRKREGERKDRFFLFLFPRKKKSCEKKREKIDLRMRYVLFGIQS